MRLEPKKESDPKRKPWLLDLRRFGKGRMWFDTAAEASRYLSSFLQEQKQFGELAWDLPLETRLRYMTFDSELTRLGVTMDVMLQFWKDQHQPKVPKLLPDGIRECLDAKRQAGRRKRTVQQLEYSLNSMLATLGPVACSSIMAEQVEAWLGGQGWAPRTRLGRWIDAQTFFAFALRKGWVLSNPALAMEKPQVEHGAPGILTVPQVQRLLAACRKVCPEALPFFIIGLFSGLRPSEIMTLEWERVRNGHISVESVHSKTRRRRLIPIQPNLAEWLELGGDLPPLNWQRRWDRVRKAGGFAIRGKRKGEPWPHDCMRHSFCTYALPVFGVKDTALWAGHSEDVLLRDYAERVTKEEAKKFWALMPNA